MDLQSDIPLRDAIQAFGKRRHDQGYLEADAILDEVPFQTLIDLLPSTDSPAIFSIDLARKPCTHAMLKRFIVEDVNFEAYGVGRNDRVAILFPNGPELAVAFVAVLSYCTSAPLNPANTPQEIKGELQNVNARAIMVQAGEDNEGILAVAEELDLVVIECTVDAGTAGVFRMEVAAERVADRNASRPRGSSTSDHFGPQQRGDCAMVLHTSGSTGNKKVVPHRVDDLLAGAITIAAACQLAPTDICCNQMPLFHIGGIARNVLSPIISGGAVVCMPYLEPKLFWEVCKDFQCTWYYAGPTMHTMILESYKAFPTPRPKISLRFIANAAGPLLPSVAEEMRDVYSAAAGGFCSVMPSYGMTECMPISSPPVGYNLDRPGTSGQVVGPRCSIRDAATGEELPANTVGEICVSGHPVMRAYENNPEETKKNFIGEWFKTGDLGYLDDDRYLFVTGRSKEVINRGGEIISPIEIEEALTSHPSIKALVAFSTPHSLLQETIGVCIVTPQGAPRISLESLQEHAALDLHPSKWPQLIVYADDLPKTATGKAMRVRLDKRMSLPTISDETHEAERLFEAAMLPPGAPVQEPIPTQPLRIDLAEAAEHLKAYPEVLDAVLTIRLVDRKPCLVAFVTPSALDATKLRSKLLGTIHEYLIPKVIMPIEGFVRAADGTVDESALPEVHSARAYVAPRNETEAQLQALWITLLGVEPPEASVDADFFLSGGSSLLAGTLAGLIKKAFGMPLSGTALFRMRTIGAIAEAVEAHKRSQSLEEATKVRSMRQSQGDGEHSHKRAHYTQRESKGGTSKAPPKEQEPLSQTSILPLVVQALPLLFFHPIRRLASWGLFIFVWITLMNAPPILVITYHMTEEWWYRRFYVHNSSLPSLAQLPSKGKELHRFVAMLLALLIVRLARALAFPLLGILTKWLVIGRYRAGRSRLFGSYYLRWWFVQQSLRFCGKGVFDLNDRTRVWYYKLLGAKIGLNVKIGSSCTLTESDLVSIGDRSCLDNHVTLSPFCVDSGAAMLSAIEIGDDCVVCSKTTIAPGAILPDGTCLGPLSSSHEQQDSDERNRSYCRVAFPPPSLTRLCLLGYPSIFFVFVCKMALPIVTIYCMVLTRDSDPTTWSAAITWFLSWERLCFYVLIRIERAIFTPFMELFAIILVKKLVVGPFVRGPKTRRTHFQYTLMRTLLPDGKLCGVPRLVGNHWGGVTLLMRLLGAKCGERIFWPGSGVDVVEHDLLTIEDDCVFGSRSIFLCSTAEACEPITLHAGANVADRCFVLPGVTLGVNGCFGSGSLAQEDGQFGSECVTVGSSGGQAEVLSEGGPMLIDAETVKPFGRTFYGTKNEAAVAAGAPRNTATWCVPPLWMYVLYNWWCVGFTALYRASNIVFAWAILEAIVHRNPLLALDPARQAIYALVPPPLAPLPVSPPAPPPHPPFHPSPPYAPGALSYNGGEEGEHHSYEDSYEDKLHYDELPHYLQGDTYGDVEEYAFDLDCAGYKESLGDRIDEGGGLVGCIVTAVNKWDGFGKYWLALLGVYIAVHAAMVILAYAAEVVAKWLIIGRRKVGIYPWDRSSYCMRWNVYLATSVIRQGLLVYLQGSAYLVWYFRALGCQIGKDVCLYPTGSDPMMTEPELVSIGDRACINAGFIICHTNTKGNFALNTILIGESATMRTWSRLMAGGQLAKGARLLEHTLALVGDNVEAGVIWQGWPVQAMLATKEFWTSRRHQIKLGRKQTLRSLEGKERVMPVLIRSNSSSLKPLMTKVDEVMADNAQLRERLNLDAMKQLSALEEEEEDYIDSPANTLKASSSSPSRLLRVSADAAQIEALNAKVGWLLTEVQSLREWRATFELAPQAAPAAFAPVAFDPVALEAVRVETIASVTAVSSAAELNDVIALTPAATDVPSPPAEP